MLQRENAEGEGSESNEQEDEDDEGMELHCPSIKHSMDS